MCEVGSVTVEIDSVVWHKQGNLIEVTYTDWRSEHRRGDRFVAGALAEIAGLKTAPAPDGSARWVRYPGSWQIVPRDGGGAEVRPAQA